MIDSKDEIIQLQKEVIEKCENIIALQKDKEKIMQDMIDNLAYQIDNLTEQLNIGNNFLNRK
jgi:predicted translin family RNA/ssDNA-binding protein